MHYVLTRERVESYERITVAQARAAEIPGSITVSKQEDLVNLDAKLLVSLYNVAASEPESHAKTIQRFSDGATAAKRTWPVIEYLAKPGAIPAITQSTSAESDEPMASKKKSTKKAAKSSATPGAGRPSAYAGKYIYKLAKENPRRAGTLGAKAWDLIRNGMTYEQYIEAGGERKHLVWDIEHKNLEVKANKA